ncbi:MAG: Dabb family protein [Bradyrhizobium sp.]
MIKHIVMWNVRGDTPEQRLSAAHTVKRAFESLNGRVPGLGKIEVGIDISRISYACDVVLYSEFRDLESLRAYGDHPEHMRARDEVGDLRITRHQVDYFPGS